MSRLFRVWIGFRRRSISRNTDIMHITLRITKLFNIPALLIHLRVGAFGGICLLRHRREADKVTNYQNEPLTRLVFQQAVFPMGEWYFWEPRHDSNKVRNYKKHPLAPPHLSLASLPRPSFGERDFAVYMRDANKVRNCANAHFTCFAYSLTALSFR